MLRAAWERYDGRLRTGLTPGDNNAWGYSGNPFGDDETGKFYIRPLSIWSVLTAMQGYDFNGPAGILGFAPRWKPDDHRSFFSTAEGWGTFTQKREAGRQLNSLELAYGKLSLNELSLEVPAGKKVQAVGLRIGEKRVASSFEQDGENVSIITADALELKKSELLEIALVL